ncbi:hypothetical protein MASR2M18_05650 [Ignavibacteria bacterium]
MSSYIFTYLIFPIMAGESITLRKVLIGIPIYIIFGLGFGYAMKLINRREKTDK